MKTPTRRNEEGNLLIISLGLLLGITALAGITMNVASNTARFTQRANNLARIEAAAEGALEYSYAGWLRLIAGEPIAISALTERGAVPSHIDFTYQENNGKTSTLRANVEVVALDEYGQVAPNDVKPPPITGRVPGYQGWSGNTYTYAARARINIDENTSIGVQRLFYYTEVPLFQSMFFYNTNLVLWAPAPIVINGLIHTNDSLHMAASSSDSIKIHGNATYVNNFSDSDPGPGKPYPLSNPKGPTWMYSKEAQLHKVPPIKPMGGDPSEVFDTTDNNPNNDGFREIIESPNPNHPDPEAISKRRMINKAGIVIGVSTDAEGVHTVTVTTQRNTTLTADAKQKIAGAFSKVIGFPEYKYKSGTRYNSKTKKYEDVYTTVPRQGVYDAREERYVDVVNVDVSKITEALNSNGVNGVHANVIHIMDTTPAGVGNAGDKVNNNPKTFRLQNGKVLPNNGLTFSSPNPVYIQGDYNTGSGTVPTNGSSNPTTTTSPTSTGYERKPAAVIADAVMFLSNNWNDSNSDKKLSSRTASHTTFNTAILAGIKPTDDYNYSGGANNFPRFLENWDGKRCTYFGSMVELFNSEVFTGYWDLGDIYKPPNRYWNFDTKFLQTPPPGSVEAIVLSRGPWARF